MSATLDTDEGEGGAVAGNRWSGRSVRDSGDRAREARGSRGRIRTVAPSRSSPDQTVPVTTVPVPFTVKTRSIGRRKRSPVGFCGTDLAMELRADRSSGIPLPVVAETGTITASRSPVGSRKVCDPPPAPSPASRHRRGRTW